jgi:hypothetical protein
MPGGLRVSCGCGDYFDLTSTGALIAEQLALGFDLFSAKGAAFI